MKQQIFRNVAFEVDWINSAIQGFVLSLPTQLSNNNKIPWKYFKI